MPSEQGRRLRGTARDGLLLNLRWGTTPVYLLQYSGKVRSSVATMTWMTKKGNQEFRNFGWRNRNLGLKGHSEYVLASNTGPSLRPCLWVGSYFQLQGLDIMGVITSRPTPTRSSPENLFCDVWLKEWGISWSFQWNKRDAFRQALDAMITM